MNMLDNTHASQLSPVPHATLDHYIHPTSHIQLLMTLCFLGLSVGLFSISMATDAQAQSIVLLFGLMGVMMLVGVGVWRHQQHTKQCCYVALTTTSDFQGDKDSMLMQNWRHWQLGFSHSKSVAYAHNRPADFELWEAQLLTTQDLGWCVCLRFAVSHPILGDKTLVIWRDQVPQSVWRSLKIIAKWAT